jgi:hypothetical protein
VSASYEASSSAVRWFEFHEWVQQRIDGVGEWPMVGTQAWFDLAEDDERKLAAVYDAASHFALRVETCQIAECEASHAVSGALDWGAFAQAQRRHNEFYAQKPWLRRAKRVDS